MSSLGLQHFETFLEVANQGSFTAAAAVMGVSKTAVSQAIRSLELSLKTSLFIRSTRRIQLTDEGEMLFAQCQRLKDELDITRSLIGKFNEFPTGTLRISCNAYMAETKLLSIIKSYVADYPKVKIELMTQERMPDMYREGIDVVFGVNCQASDDVVARLIGKTRYVICASPDYFKKNGLPENIKELEKHFYIPHLGRTPENIISQLKHPTLLTMSPRLSINNASVMKQSAMFGLGIVQLHHYMVEEELKRGDLVEVLKDKLHNEVSLYMYYQKHRFVQPKIRQFVNLVIKELSSHE